MKIADLQHPMQPIGYAEDGTIRFKPNKIVTYLLDLARNQKITLNELLEKMLDREFSQEDYTQLMQLIGYSVSGYRELSTSPSDLVARADDIAKRLREGLREEGGLFTEATPYVYRPTLLEHVIEDISDPFDSIGTVYRDDAPPSRILFISRGESEEYEPVILHWIGDAADYFRESGEMADVLRGYPAGTWIWEGTIKVDRWYDGYSGGYETDIEAVGDARPLTDEEWEWFAEQPDEPPWDPNLWHRPRHGG